jgi:hypothetical protein
MTATLAAADARFDAKHSTDENGCWLWTGGIAPHGYGIFWFEGKSVSAHRWSWERANGPVPDGLELDHLCRVRHCVNPEHLEPVTRAENHRRGLSDAAARARQQAKTHCPQGHPYSGDNLIKRPGDRRGCRTCQSGEGRRAIAAKRAAAEEAARRQAAIESAGEVYGAILANPERREQIRQHLAQRATQSSAQPAVPPSPAERARKSA